MVDTLKLKIKYDKNFEKSFKKKDNSVKIKVKKQMKKIIENPLIGKPMRNVRKDSREVYVAPYRLSYAYFISDDVEDINKNIYKLIFLDLYHKDEQNILFAFYHSKSNNMTSIKLKKNITH